MTQPLPRQPLAVFLSAVFATAGLSQAAADDAMAVRIGTFDRPTYVAAAPGMRRYLFVTEQAGRIRILRDEVPLARAFLDIAHLVLTGAGQPGLHSMAFAPDYVTSGRFYIAFNNRDGDIEIDEFLRSDNPRRADRSSRRVLLVIRHRDGIAHHGGQLQFSADGLLYISTGDGGVADPRGEPARRLDNLLGKILRIDPLPRDGKPYGVPPTNPFVGTGNRPEIYAYGLRNPWRFSFDRNRIAIADVGQGRREEVNFLLTENASGVNFGWPEYEGELVFDATRPGPDPATPPMFTYPHSGGGCAVIGGYVVRDPALPALAGRYLYGDACTGDVRSFVPRVGAQRAADDRPTGIVLPGISSFGQGFGGKLYAAQISGELWRIEPPAP